MQNLLESCTFCEIDLNKVSDKTRKELTKDFDLDEIDKTIILTEDCLKKYNIDYDCIIDYQFDKEELNYIITDQIGKYPYYLVFASNVRWNGSSGYKICDEPHKTCERDYDVTLLLNRVEKNAMFCIESSHDVPTGAETIIIGLSIEDYERLNDAEFKEVEEFVSKYR